MANSIEYQNQQIRAGETISIHYKIKEGDKDRVQIFKGILIKIRGNRPETKTITVRKLSKSGVAIERIFPLNSPLIEKIVLIKKTTYRKSKAYFIRNLSEQNIKRKLYKSKN